MTENPFLTGNFAPVAEECTALDLPITGTLPPELTGRLLRIGPNPIAPEPATHHWFLGNGMVHGVCLRDGKAEWYRNRFVRDGEVVQARGWPPVEGPQPAMEIGSGLANTNVIGHAGRTFAIVEAGNLPVELSYELETVARSNFGGTLAGGFTAHPKCDPDTGELHAAVYSPFWEHVQYVVVGTDGSVRRSVEVSAPGKPMVHDCAITRSWFIVFDLPCIFDPQMVAEGRGLPYRWNSEYPARVGLVRRESDAPVIWAEVEPCYVFHPMNAYEDADGRVVLDVVRHPKMFANELRGPNEGAPTLDRWIVDPKGGPVKEQRLDDTGQEFPRHDERLIGKPYRYGYTAGFGEGPAMGDLYMHDLRDGKVTVHSEGKDRLFLEPVFVPVRDGAAEDDGWVLAYVYDASTDKADVVVLHAQDFAAAPVATIHLPQRVPYGFHGNWVPD